MLGTFIISHQASLSSPLPTPGHPPHGKPLALPTLMGAPQKSTQQSVGGETPLLVQEQLLLLLRALAAQQQLQNTPPEKGTLPVAQPRHLQRPLRPHPSDTVAQ